jgi:hypothetical protein
MLLMVALWAMTAAAQTDSVATAPPDSLTTQPADRLASDLIARVDILEKARRAAMISANTKQLASIMSEHATYTHSTGLMQTRDQLLRALEAGKFHYLSVTVDEVKYRAYNDTVVGSGVQRIDVESGGKTLTLRSRYTVVYVLAGGELKLVAYQSTSSPGGRGLQAEVTRLARAAPSP